MSSYLGWKIRGYYDGKIAVIESGYAASDCVFLDMEIFRQGVRSVGHHMLLLNKNSLPENWKNFHDCISLNSLRNYDGTHDFSSKYPFGTIHALIGILNEVVKVRLPKSAIIPLLFTDGTWMNLLGYTENSLDWIRYLGAIKEESPLQPLFLNDHYSLYSLMVDMNKFLRRRDQISITGERGDRIAVTTRGGDRSPRNLVEVDGLYQLNEDAKSRGEAFINLLSELTKWEYKPRDWKWRNWKLFQFTKGDFASSQKRINIQNFNELMKKNPLSWAMTSGNNIEFTLEEPDTLP